MKTALVSGANRGIGKEIVLQLAHKGVRVYALGRDAKKLEEAVGKISPHIIPVVADMNDRASLKQQAVFIAGREQQLDILINNAGIISSATAAEFDVDELQHVFHTNVYGVMHLTAACWNLLMQSSDARIITVSSGMGAFEDAAYPDHAAYRLSKQMINTWARQLAHDAPKNISVNNICPGWCHTDMGGKNAPRTPAQGADTAVWLATESKKVTGKFWRDRKEIGW